MQTGKTIGLQGGYLLLAGAGILLCLIISAGCTGQEAGSRLNGTDWILTGYLKDATTVPALPGAGVTLSFGEDGGVSGSAGCNRYFAAAEVKGTTITIGQTGSTEMYCSTPGVMEQETAYLTLLASAAMFTLDGDHLSLADARGTVLLTFAKLAPPVPAPFTGTPWTLVSFHERDAVSSVLAGTTITAVFGGDGRISGAAGCNQYFAQYQATGTSLTVGQVGSTKMFCHRSGVMEQEHRYLTGLSRVQSYLINGNQLTLFDTSGDRILTFSARA